MEFMRIEAYVITPEGVFRHAYPNNGINFTADELIQIVSGHIKIITLKGEYKGKVLVVTANAQGRELKLKRNPVATGMAGRRVYGNALICERSLIK